MRNHNQFRRSALSSSARIWLLSGGFALLAAAPGGAVTIRVPADQPTLQRAIDRVGQGDVIELAAGTYAAPNTSFRIRNIPAEFTIRAAAGATVVLTGDSARSILRFENGNRSRGRTVVFERLIFADGQTTTQKTGGAATLLSADAIFRECTFRDNASFSANSGGGAVLLADDARAVFLDTVFTDNVSSSRGGAIVATASTVVVERGRFLRNRTNPPGHNPVSVGGAISLLDGQLRVFHSTFEANEAAWTGGAIYSFGTFAGEPRAPVADVSIVASKFLGNLASAIGAVPGPTFGGAIHVEDQTTLRVHGSTFEGNRAELGGGISSYRALVEVRDGVFRGNEARRVTSAAAGGAISIDSVDFADASTGNGQHNRRSAELLIEDSFFQSRFGDVDAGAELGGCLATAGDTHRHFGDGGVVKDGSVAQNRARVTIRRSAFVDCDVHEPSTGGLGGAISATFTELRLEDSLVLDSDALPASLGSGGGLRVVLDSSATLVRSGFATNTASRGGALFVSGSHLAVEQSSFVRNEVSVGVAEAVSESFGAALFAIPRASANDPSRQGPVTGEIRDSLFADQRGLALWESDFDAGPINDLRYRGNRFFESSFSNKVWVNVLLDRQGRSVSELANIVVARSAGSTVKVSAPNQALFSRPREGRTLVVPTRLPRVGDPATDEPGFAAAVWSGNLAALGGVVLPLGGGLRELANAGEQVLVIDGVGAGGDSLAASRCTGGQLLCLADDRFLAEVSFADGQGNFGAGTGEPIAGDTGQFWFFSPSNVELVVKALDGRSVNGRFWLFYGALSDVAYTLRVLDSVTGRLQDYVNPRGQLASVGDTDAFPATAGASSGQVNSASEEPEVAAPSSGVPAAVAACTPNASSLCLAEGRYRVEISWRTATATGSGQAIPFSGDTGFFWFFSPSNVEVVIKILDGRPINGHIWVFFGALSDVEYTVTVTDTVTGAVETYRNPAGTQASVADTSAF